MEKKKMYRYISKNIFPFGWEYSVKIYYEKRQIAVRVGEGHNNTCKNIWILFFLFLPKKIYSVTISSECMSDPNSSCWKKNKTRKKIRPWSGNRDKSQKKRERNKKKK